eukprot:115497_1
MNSSLFCDCIGNDSVPLWTNEMTVSHIVAISVSGAVFLSLVGLIGLCVRYYTRKSKKKGQKEVEKTSTEIEMENKQLMRKESGVNNLAIVMECDNDSGE